MIGAPTPEGLAGLGDRLRQIGPGVLLAAVVAVAAVLAEPMVARLAAGPGGKPLLPALVLALLIGMALHKQASQPLFQPGLLWCVKRLLRLAVALLGLRVGLGDIVALGSGVALLVIASLALTVVAGIGLARLFNRDDAYGALAGGATAVCGASAALATASVLPSDPKRDADTVFVVVAVNALSTLAMVTYPTIAAVLGFDDRVTGIFLGATIHDVAQVVGAAYGVSDAAGNTAVIVKLFRVLLLLPVVLAIGWWFAPAGGVVARARVPVPAFAIGFLAFVLVNTVLSASPAASFAYAPVKDGLGEVSRWGLLLAIAALGLGTSVSALAKLGWRHVAVVCGTTVVILVAVLGGLLLMGP